MQHKEYLNIDIIFSVQICFTIDNIFLKNSTLTCKINRKNRLGPGRS